MHIQLKSPVHSAVPNLTGHWSSVRVYMGCMYQTRNTLPASTLSAQAHQPRANGHDGGMAGAERLVQDLELSYEPAVSLEVGAAREKARLT